jgi:hypothetical protein
MANKFQSPLETRDTRAPASKTHANQQGELLIFKNRIL